MSSTAIHTLGIDIGSTTVKVAVLSPDKELLFRITGVIMQIFRKHSLL